MRIILDYLRNKSLSLSLGVYSLASLQISVGVIFYLLINRMGGTISRLQALCCTIKI